MDLAINNDTNLCNFVGKMVCVFVCVRVYLELLSHFLPIKINLTNISPILIKIVDFKNLARATSFATWASRKFIYLPYRASGEEKKSLSYPKTGYYWSVFLLIKLDNMHKQTGYYWFVFLLIELDNMYRPAITGLYSCLGSDSVK